MSDTVTVSIIHNCKTCKDEGVIIIKGEYPYKKEIGMCIDCCAVASDEDAKSWYLLGHAALKLSDASAAAQAFAKTDALVENDVSVKFYWLQARLMANNGQLDNVSEGLANQLLSMDPNNSPVLELL